MKRLLICMLVACFLISATTKKYQIQLSITSTTVYCGGAAPTEELLKNLATPVPYVNQKFYIKKGLENTASNKIFKEVTTDSLGQIQLVLPAGTYILVDEQRKNYEYYHEVLSKFSKATNYEGPVDSACFKKWYRTPLLKFVVGGKNSKSQFPLSIEIGCAFHGKPCIPYNGPTPP